MFQIIFELVEMMMLRSTGVLIVDRFKDNSRLLSVENFMMKNKMMMIWMTKNN